MTAKVKRREQASENHAPEALPVRAVAVHHEPASDHGVPIAHGSASKGDDTALSARIETLCDAIPAVAKQRADAGKRIWSST